MAQADFTRISSNIAALNTLNSLRNINTKLGKAQLRLATGKRINQASDDPAGLTIALKMNARKEGLGAALGNIGDAKNMLAVAESGLTQMNDILTEMKAKATAAASDTLGTEERAAISAQLKSLAQQINDIVSETTWNDDALLDGTVNKSLQTGAGSTDTTVWTLSRNHSATELEVATSSGNAVIASLATSSTSFAATSTLPSGAGAATVFTGLATLDSGNYKFKILDKAVGATTGKATSQTDLLTVAGVGGLTQSAGAADELDSGFYQIKFIRNTATTTISYAIYDQSGGVVAAANSAQVAAGVVTLLGDTDTDLGIKLTGVVEGSIASGSSIYVEYIKQNEAKAGLYAVSGSTETAVQIDANGTDDSTTFGVNDLNTFFYGTAAATFDTGRGIEVKLGSFASITANSYTSFSYTEANDLTVSLVDSDDATAYMEKVDTALSNVTSSLNDIGSLVSRLDKKEEAVGSAMVNTEAAYNRIMNADMALEQVEASKYMILQQTAVAMLAQSNMAPQGILSLFR